MDTNIFVAYNSDPTIALQPLGEAAARLDNFRIRFQKRKPSIVLEKRLQLFNYFWSQRDFPSNRKNAPIFPFNKTGKNASQAHSYQPISLICTLGKLYEKTVARYTVGYNAILACQKYKCTILTYEHNLRSNLYLYTTLKYGSFSLLFGHRPPSWVEGVIV